MLPPRRSSHTRNPPSFFRAPACSVMQDCTASKGLDQIAALMAEGKVKVHLDK